MNKQERSDLPEWAMECALKKGADEVAVDLFSGRQVNVEYRNNKLENLQENTRFSLSLDIYSDSRYSSHVTNNLSKSSLKDFIENAVLATKYLSQDRYRSLPDPKYYPSDMDGKLELFDDYHSNLTTDYRIKTVKEIQDAARGLSDKIISVETGFSDGCIERTKVHSNGFFGKSASTSFWTGASVTARDEDARPEDWNWVQARFFKDLPDPQTIGRQASERVLRKLGQRKIKSGKYDIIVENRNCKKLLNMLSGPLRARFIQQKSSFLGGMLNKKIASKKLTVIDDPFIKRGLGSKFFDNEGLEMKERIVIEKGILKEFYIDTYYGKKLGWEPNSGSNGNILVQVGNKSCNDMIQGLQKAILVTGFIGGNSNSTTGDFSFGLQGILIDQGRLAEPINEINISGNVIELWNSLTQVGNDPYPFSSFQLPSMQFSGVDITGI